MRSKLKLRRFYFHEWLFHTNQNVEKRKVHCKQLIDFGNQIQNMVKREDSLKYSQINAAK